MVLFANAGREKMEKFIYINAANPVHSMRDWNLIVKCILSADSANAKYN